MHYFDYRECLMVVCGSVWMRRNAGRGLSAEDGRIPVRHRQEPIPVLERLLRKDRTEVTFILPADAPPGQVSVVGDSNDWRPGVHTLLPSGQRLGCDLRPPPDRLSSHTDDQR
ncbi:hypothetical protein ABT024_35090 [Streptomyces sp. NPDC002812]|uniref:hypothetical protein n=1 Tax=Streptomyces sp. NPDC002812 TaxID=3154434 RepID=UPI003322B5DB